VEMLLISGASPNLCDKNNTTPLIWASRRGKIIILASDDDYYQCSLLRSYGSRQFTDEIQC
jgi:ankyrin repeat protein